MKKILKFAAIAATAFALLSCEKTPEGSNNNSGSGNNKPGTTDEPTLTEDIEFELEVTKLESDEAKIKVTHNGTKTETWYGFVTTANDPDEAFEDKLDELVELLEDGEEIDGLKKGKSKSITVDELEPETDYYYIVFAMTAEGEYYGEYNYVDFTTPEEPFVVEGYVENPAWTVTYEGPYEENGTVYEHTAWVESTDNNFFFVTAWPVDYFEEYGIEEIAEMEIASWLEYLSTTKYTFADILSNESSLHAVDINVEYGTEWYIIAIGANSNGTATGYYALSEVVTMTEEEMTEGYAAWLGNWKFTGANGKSMTVKFSKGLANTYFKMTGYENLDYPVKVEWYEEDQAWIILNQKLGQYNFGQYGVGTIWFLGETEEEDFYPYEGIPICIGGLLEDGTRISEGYEESWENESTGEMESYAVHDMLYLADIPDYGYGVISDIGEQGAFPSFPITITPAESASQYSTDMGFKSSKISFKITETPAAFKAYDFNKSARIR